MRLNQEGVSWLKYFFQQDGDKKIWSACSFDLNTWDFFLWECFITQQRVYPLPITKERSIFEKILSREKQKMLITIFSRNLKKELKRDQVLIRIKIMVFGPVHLILGSRTERS